MSVLPILTWPDERLSTACAPCTPSDDVTRLANDMLETMYDAPGRGLAAPQVGHLLQLFVMDATWKESTPTPLVFLNPSITATGTEVATSNEGCLSIPGVLAQVSRPSEIEVTWQSLSGLTLSDRFTGFAAVCIQHEIDHLNGIVTLDRLTPADRSKVLAEYETTDEPTPHSQMA